jgi:hypothetical protein
MEDKTGLGKVRNNSVDIHEALGALRTIRYSAESLQREAYSEDLPSTLLGLHH